MGPYHDLDPSVTQPTQQVKYEIFGTAPNRKWILSFYKNPLFKRPVIHFIENTHQIILMNQQGDWGLYKRYADLFNWNEGRSMIGLQDETKTKGIMAPEGLLPMRPGVLSAWTKPGGSFPKDGIRFTARWNCWMVPVPVVAVGDTTRIDANTFETFPEYLSGFRS